MKEMEATEKDRQGLGKIKGLELVQKLKNLKSSPL